MALGVAAPGALAQTQITYQGRLDEGGFPYTGAADLTLAVFAAESGMTALATQMVSNVQVTDGLFTAIADLGAVPFSTEGDRWLEISVRTPASSDNPFITLTPRQKLTAATRSLSTRGLIVSPLGAVGIGGAPVGFFSVLAPPATQNSEQGAPVLLKSGNSFNNFAVGGQVLIDGALSTGGSGVGGDVSLLGGIGPSNFGDGASLVVQGGRFEDGLSKGGGVTIISGDGASPPNPVSTGGAGGDIRLQGGAGDDGQLQGGDGGSIILQPGAGGSGGFGENGDRGTVFVDGALGINTSEPTAPLHVRSASNSTTMRLERDGGAIMRFEDNSGTAREGLFGFDNSVPNHLVIRNLTPNGDLVLGTAFGQVGIGTSIADALNPLHIQTGAIGADWQIRLSNTAVNNFQTGMRVSDNGFFEVTNQIGGASFARLSSAGTWTAVSDASIKRDVQDAPDLLDAAMALRPVTFRFKDPDTGEARGGEQLGLIAQEVEPVLPAFVDSGNQAGDLRSVNYAGLSVVAIGALQEQQREIEALRKEVQELKALVRDMTSHQKEAGQ